MQKFLIINDFNDINEIYVRHFSLDKGHYIAKSLSKLGHIIYFLTTNNDYEKQDIKYISINNITIEFIDTLDYIIIVREPLIIDIIKNISAIKDKIGISKNIRKKPKFIIKSDSPVWFINKSFVKDISELFGIKRSRACVKKWVINHIDFICAQNEDFSTLALRAGVPRKSLLISGMGICADNGIDFDKLINPYTINHSYCVNDINKLGINKALWPQYYLENPREKEKCNSTKKYIIVYTGRIKTNSGKILYNMKNIMEILGDEYELHIFPGSFMIPLDNGKVTVHSSKNKNSLDILRKDVFKNNKNIIIHYPYEHKDKYKYLYFADCGIDFSDIRPLFTNALADHAKILEYCEMGLPIVCEENIHNSYLIKNGKNGIILPYMSSDMEYANAIKQIVNMQIDREYCRKVTINDENWDKKTIELLSQLEKQKN